MSNGDILRSWDPGIWGSWDICKVVLLWVYPVRLPGCQVSNCECGGVCKFWIILMMACTKVGLYLSWMFNVQCAKLFKGSLCVGGAGVSEGRKWPSPTV